MEYFFTYNPGQGALDTQKETFVLSNSSSNTDQTTGGSQTSGSTTPSQPTESTPVEDTVGNDTTGLKRTDSTIEFYVNGAEFADLHYTVNGGGQQNVGMKSDGNRNYTYTVSGLKAGDTIEYFFTYNPGQGALDTQKETYTLK